jgi:putative transposase
MPRRGRCVLTEVPCHITQRCVDRCETFSTDDDRQTYLRLLRDNLSDAGVKLLGWCVMTNHVHLIAVPGQEDSLRFYSGGYMEDMRSITTFVADARAISGRIVFCL